MMKKMDNTRSHSWWWDSHVCPKNSKWLQENLTEMDSKVSAMLKIIEEDADSFAQRAEMYYKKRPELINLVEEFYRTYRALVERYTYLTKEIRQNIAPALQAQLGVSSESPQNSPVDLHLKRGIDAPDIISPSYSYAGASEFEYDSPSSTKGQTDDESSPLGFQTNYERRAFGFKPRYASLEDSSHKIAESAGLHGTADADVAQLQKELVRLQEENKDLALKATQDASKLKDLQLELSSLQVRARSLEAEDKLTKKRLNSVQEKEQKLEAENLKLSHALISFKEERTELLEQQKKGAEDSRLAHQKIESLEGEKVGLKAELLELQLKHSESRENLKKSEEAVQKLELALSVLQEERLKDSFLMEIFEQQNQDLLKKISDFEKSNGEMTEQALARAAEAQKLQEQLTDFLKSTQALEQALHSVSQDKTCAEHERSLALSQVKDLQKEAEGIQKDRAQQSEDIARLREIIGELEKEGLRAQTEKLESAKYVHELEASMEEGQRTKETLLASCQQLGDRCKALELKSADSIEKLVSSSQELSRLEHQVQTLEDTLSSSQLQHEELQVKISSLSLEKKLLLDELQNALESAKTSEQQRAEMHVIIKDQKEEMEGCQRELAKLLDSTRKLEKELACVSKEKMALVEKEAEALAVHQQLENEHIQFKQKLELNVALIEGLNHEISCLKLEKSQLLLESQQMQQSSLELQAANTVLSSQCLKSNKDLQAAEAAAMKAQEELAFSFSEVVKLQGDCYAKDELLRERMSSIQTLEAHLARCREENSLLDKQIHERTEGLAVLEASNNDLKSRLSDFATLNKALAEQVSEKEKSLEQSMRDLVAAQRQALELNEDVASKASQALDLQQQIESLERQMVLLHAKLSESSLMKQSLEALVERLQHENSETKEANQALDCEQQRLANEILLMKSTNQDLEASLSHLAKERALLQEDVIANSNQCNGLKERIASLETDYEAAQRESATLRDQIAESEKENMSFSKKLFEAEGRVQGLQLKLSKVLAEEASLTEQLMERIGSIHVLETAVFDLQNDNTALNEEIGCLQQQASVFRTREASLLMEMQNSLDMIQGLQAEIEGLKQEASNAQESEKRVSLEQRKSLEECLSLQQKTEGLQRELDICCEQKASFLKDIASHSEQSSELLSEVRRLEAEKDCLQQDLSRAQQVEHQLRQDLNNLDEEREQLSGTVDSQRKTLAKQEEDLQGLQQVLSCTKEEHQIDMDKMKLLADEKAFALQELKKSEQELERARENCLKLQTDLDQSQQAMATIKIDLENRIEELGVLKENTSILEGAKVDLEQRLQSCLRQALQQEEEGKRLVEMLAAARQENATLEQHLVDAQRRMIDTDEECDTHRKDFEALKLELTATVTTRKELEQELVQLQADKATCFQKLEEMCQELKCLREQKDISDTNLQSAIVQGHENMSKLLSLQEELLAARNLNLESAEKLSQSSDEWGAAERKLQDEILQLKSELEFQHNNALKLEDEVSLLQAEKNSLGSEKASMETQVVDLKQQTADLKTQISEKQQEFLEVCAQAELLSVKEKIILELQKQVQLLREENKDLSQKLQNSDAELLQVKANLEILEGELHELQEKLCESQFESQERELSYQALAGENVSIKEQNRELTGALSMVEAENTVLESKLAAETAALDVAKHDLSALKKDKGEALQRACLYDARPVELHQSLMEAQAENEMSKKCAVAAAEDANCLTTDLQALHPPVSRVSRNHQQGEELLDSPFMDLELLQQELASEREENIKLSKMASDDALTVRQLQEEVSRLYDGRQDLESAIKLLECQLVEAQKMKEALLGVLQDRSQKFLQMMSKMKDLDKMISNNLESKQAMLSEVPAADSGDDEQSAVPEHYWSDSVRIRGAISSSSEASNRDQEGLFDAEVKIIDKIKENVLVLLNESHQVEVVASIEQQEQVSHLQEEIGHLTSELKSYKQDVLFLQKFLHGEELRGEGEDEVAHEDVRVLLVMLHNLQGSVVMLEEQVRELKEEVERESIQKRSLQLIIADCQVKGLSFTSLLKNNLLVSCKGLRTLASEWNEKACNKESHQIINSIEKLSKAEALCNSSEFQDEEKSCKEERICLEPRASQPPTGACNFLLEQLQKRVTEFSLLAEAVQDMLPLTCWEEQCNDEKERALVGTSKESNDSPPTDQNQDSYLHPGGVPVSAEHLGSDIVPFIGMAESIVEEISEELMHEENEIIGTASLDEEKEIDLIEGLAQLHINLGMRLHQALLDEKLENELQELKEERKKLREDLQARVEQVRGMEAELEKLQVILKGGNEEGEMLDPKQQQQRLRHKRRAEKRARRLSRELVVQRRHVGKLQDAVVAWTEQQELATEMLEKQVLTLVSTECAPTMEGWDPDQVSQLMQEMQSRKALTRRHSMDLQSVGQSLQRVGSSIESTQRLLVEETEQEQEANQDGIGRKAMSTNASSDVIKNHRKLSKFGLTWLLLLFSARRGLTKGSANDTATTTPSTPKQVQRNHDSASPALSSLVAQTRKMRCCGCATGSDRPHHPKPLDEK